MTIMASMSFNRTKRRRARRVEATAQRVITQRIAKKAKKPAATRPGSKPPPKAKPKGYPAATFPNWMAAIDMDRLASMPITDMRGGGYKANPAWLDKAFHPSEKVHPNEKQRRALRRVIAINRILDIANGTNYNALKRAGVTMPPMKELLAGYESADPPKGKVTGWYKVGEGQRQKWYIYRKLKDLCKINDVPFLTQTQAYDRYIEKGGQLQGHSRVLDGGRRRPFAEGLGANAGDFDCRRDRFGACVPEGDGAGAALREPGSGDATYVLGPFADPSRPPPTRGTLQTQVAVDRPGSLQRYLQPRSLQQAVEPARGSFQQSERPGRRGRLQPADPAEPGPRGSFQAREGRGGRGTFQRSGSGSASLSPSAAATNLATAVATTASTSYATTSSNVAGFFDDVGDIIERGAKLTDPFELRKGREGFLNLADFAEAAAPFAAFIPGAGPLAIPMFQQGSQALRQLATKGASADARAGSIAQLLSTRFPDQLPPGLVQALFQSTGPAAVPVSRAARLPAPAPPPPPPPAAPPAKDGVEKHLPMIAAAAGVAGVLILATRK